MSLPDELEEERDPLGDRIIARLAAVTKSTPVWVWIVAVVVILFLMAIVSGANGGNNSASQPAPAAVQEEEAPVAIQEEEAPAPAVVPKPEPEPNSPAFEQCLKAWEEENRAVQEGIVDDTTLIATARECTTVDDWKRARIEVGYNNFSPNLILALCGFEPNSPMCLDAAAGG